jgi:nucleoside-diphosphate-sugar epimerase
VTPRLALVTGAGGWLGSRLLHALVHGLPEAPDLKAATWQVRALVLDRADGERVRKRFPAVDVRVGDLRRPDACTAFCAGAEGAVVFHTAGVVHPARVRDFVEINVDGTRHLLAAAIAASAARVVATSSNSPFGCNPRPDHTFDESSPYHPYMGYGRSKMLMEQEVIAAQQTGRIETVLIRAPWFYGPDQPPRQTLFFRMIRDGRVPIVGDGNNRRSMAYLDNLCQGLWLAATAPVSGQAFWVADERPYTMNEIIDTVEHLLETEFGIPCAHRRLRLPYVAGEVATAADYLLQSAGIYAQKIHVLSEMNKTIACRVTRAQEVLGYRPVVDLREGMRRSIRSCLETGPL